MFSTKAKSGHFVFCTTVLYDMDRVCVAAYLTRMGIGDDPATLPANEKTLKLLMAAHNLYVPFEVRI